MMKTRVLIVDDDANMTRYLSSYLARHDFDVNIAGSGEEAIRMFRAYDPQLVLLDVAMGGMNGLNTLERIKQIKPNVSVIMISGQNNAELIFRASKLGADDYIIKPFEPKELDMRLEEPLQRRVALTPDNYTFTLAGDESAPAGAQYILQVEPRTRDKFLYRGCISHTRRWLISGCPHRIEASARFGWEANPS